jgi:hypothetical protein
MCTPLACSDYYEASAPSHGHQPTTDVAPDPGPDARMGGGRGWFPRSPHDRSARSAPSSTPAASPSPTPQSFSVASPPVRVSGFGVDHPTLGQSCAAPRPRSARFGAGTTITGLLPLVHSRYTLWPRLPDPARLAVPRRPDVVGAAFRPPRRSPAQAAPSFNRAAATARRRRIHTSARSSAPRGALVTGQVVAA